MFYLMLGWKCFKLNKMSNVARTTKSSFFLISTLYFRWAAVFTWGEGWSCACGPLVGTLCSVCCSVFRALTLQQLTPWPGAYKTLFLCRTCKQIIYFISLNSTMMRCSMMKCCQFTKNNLIMSSSAQVHLHHHYAAARGRLGELFSLAAFKCAAAAHLLWQCSDVDTLQVTHWLSMVTSHNPTMSNNPDSPFK